MLASLLLGSLLLNPVDAGETERPTFKEIRAPSLTAAPQPMTSAVTGFSLQSAVDVARNWGTVTSTLRSPAHNRRVGGAPNSHHLRGRAIDIARRPGVAHWQIDAAFRNAGYRLIESLDEGDHSHFAFADPRPQQTRPIATIVGSETDPGNFRVIIAPKRRD